MPNYSDARLAEMAAILRDQVTNTRDWHTQYRGMALALVEDLQEARAQNSEAFKNRLVAGQEADQVIDNLNARLATAQNDIEGLDGEIAHLESEVTRQDKTIAELNASNQQLAQTIKDMDAGYQRNVQRFEAIMKIASETPKLPECVPAFAAIWTFANAGAQEEGENP